MYKSIFFSIIFVLTQYSCIAQKSTLAKRVESLLKDPQMQYAQLGYGVLNLATEKNVFSHNTKTILTPASTLKVVTSIAAYDVLGKDFRFSTKVYNCLDKSHADTIHLEIKSSGDPTFGSNNFESTKAEVLLEKIKLALQNSNQKHITVSFDDSNFSSQAIPNGWAYNDIGNYYGTGSFSFNWRENQNSIHLKSGQKIGDSVEVLESFYPFVNELVSGKIGSGDNCFVYPSFLEKRIFLRGSIPINENNFVVKAASFNPKEIFEIDLKSFLKQKIVSINYQPNNCKKEERKLIFEHLSPALEEIVTLFNKKSINLYGEAIVKRIALEKAGFGDTKTGIDFLKNHYEKKGLNVAAFNWVDGSGLSATNGINISTQLQFLKYAYQQKLKNSFVNSLPLIDGLRIKSGTISGVKAYSGYAYNKKGEVLAFSIVANNFSGSSSELGKKLLSILEILKETE